MFNRLDRGGLESSGCDSSEQVNNRCVPLLLGLSVESNCHIFSESDVKEAALPESVTLPVI